MKSYYFIGSLILILSICLVSCGDKKEKTDKDSGKNKKIDKDTKSSSKDSEKKTYGKIIHSHTLVCYSVSFYFYLSLFNN